MTLLAHRVLGTSHAARRTIILHGVLGRKNNWGSIARELLRADSDQQIILPDLRLHGDSQDFDPPHTVESAARDVVKLVHETGGADRIIGHSLGSKVATVAAHTLDQGRDHKPHELWLIDGSPTSEPDGWIRSAGARVVRTLEELGTEFESRDVFLRQLEDSGFSRSVAIWLAMNLRSTVRGGASFALDLAAIEALLRDYFVVDGWSRLASMPKVKKHLVVGTDSDVVSADDQQRFAKQGEVHLIASAGHWVHVDQPQVLVDRLTRTPVSSPP